MIHRLTICGLLLVGAYVVSPAFSKEEGDKKTIAIPGEITDVAPARGGQVLVLWLANEKKVVIVDTAKQAIIKTLPQRSSDVLIAGTADHFFIVDLSVQSIERWSIDRLNREAAASAPTVGVIKAIAAGESSAGPLMVYHTLDRHRPPDQNDKDPFARNKMKLTLIDPVTLKAIPIAESKNFVNQHSVDHDPALRAAADGSACGLSTSLRENGDAFHFAFGPKEMNVTLFPKVGAYLALSADGKYAFTAGLGPFTSDGVALLSNPNYRIPPFGATSSPEFYLKIPPPRMPFGDEIPEPGASTAIEVFQHGTKDALVTLPSLDLGKPKPGSQFGPCKVTFDRRVYFNIPGQLLVSIPFTNKSIVVQSVDFLGELKKSGKDYFYVASTPPRSFEKGSSFQYAIKTESKAPKVTYELSLAPEGMAVSERGELTWSVPKDLDDKSVDVVVSIQSGEKQLYHSFKLRSSK